MTVTCNIKYNARYNYNACWFLVNRLHLLTSSDIFTPHTSTGSATNTTCMGGGGDTPSRDLEKLRYVATSRKRRYIAWYKLYWKYFHVFKGRSKLSSPGHQRSHVPVFGHRPHIFQFSSETMLARNKLNNINIIIISNVVLRPQIWPWVHILGFRSYKQSVILCKNVFC